MILHSVEIFNFRSIKHLKLADLPDHGLVMIHGPNEHGKSTVMEAVGMALEKRHNSKARDVQVVRPIGFDESPEVKLHMSLGEYEFNVSKRWGRGAKHELNVLKPAQARRSYTGSEADDALEQILAEHLDSELRNLLFVKQGELGPAQNVAGIPSLSKVLAARTAEPGAEPGESSTDFASALSDNTLLEQRVETEYLRFFSKTGKESGELKACNEEVEQAQVNLKAAQDAYNAVESSVSAIARAQEQLQHAKEKLPDCLSELEEVKLQLAAAEELKRNVDQAAVRMEQANNAAAQSEKALQARVQRQNEVEQLHAAHNAMLERCEQAKAAAEEEEQLEQQAKIRLSELRENDRELAARAQTLAGLQARLEAESKLEMLQKQQERIAAINAELETLNNVPEVTQASVEEVESANREFVVSCELAKVSAAKIVFEPLDQPVDITLDGADTTIGAVTEHNVPSEVSFEHAGLRATFHAGQDTVALSERVAAAESALEAALKRCGYKELAALREARDNWQRAVSESEILRRERSGLLGNTTEAELAATVAAITEQLAAPRPHTDFDSLDADAIGEHLSALEAERAKLQEQISQVDRENAQGSSHQARTKLVEISTEARLGEQRLGELRGRLEQEEAETSTAVLQAELARALADKEQAADDLAAKQALVEEANVEQVVASFEALQAEAQTFQQQITEANARIDAEQRHIDAGQGSAETLEHAKDALEQVVRRQRSIQRQAAAVRLLRERLQVHRDEMRRKYTEPYLVQLTSLAKVLYGNSVEFEVNEKLEIVARSVDGTEVPVTQLSGGAQEQLALLNRFAIAQLTSDTKVPIFVDDALGATDPHRIRQLAGLFKNVASNTQVFLLTCARDRYASFDAQVEVDIESAVTRFG